MKINKRTRRPWEPKPKPKQSGRLRNDKKFYQSWTWRKKRRSYLDANPLCEECLGNGFYVEANVVDHITPIREGGAPLDDKNLQSMCDRCHNRKSGRERHKKKKGGMG